MILMSSDFTEDQRPRRLLVQDAARLADVEEKHQRVRDMLEAVGADALLLQDPANISWFTAGADLFRFGVEDSLTSVFVTPEARLFATNSVDSAQIFEREVFGLGFQVKQREWFQPPGELVDDLCRGRKVISDRGPQGTRMARDRIRSWRLPLTKLEVERLRTLSKVAVHAVEASAHNVKAGVTESEVAGEVSHRLIKRTVAPARIQVCADGRNQRYRHWTFGEHPIQNYAVIACSARRWGLHVAVTRTVCVGSVAEELKLAYQQAVLVHATGMFFSRSGKVLGDVWKKVQRIYEKFGIPFEWQKADQADVIGYGLSEARVTPDSEYQLPAPAPVFWHPSVGPAMVGDTLLCHDGKNEMLTQSSSWPQITATVKGRDVSCPGILLVNRDQQTSPELISQVPTESLIAPPVDLPVEEAPVAIDSIWEMELPPIETAVWEEDDSPYPEESVLE